MNLGSKIIGIGHSYWHVVVTLCRKALASSRPLVLVLTVCLLQPVLVQRESKLIWTNHKSPPTTCEQFHLLAINFLFCTDFSTNYLWCMRS
ncbi:hypothetical protein Taro_002432 [Colocasia esculenta]|uniref:Uncharacterized protein n=1 Tax=Colocasia esculenta TaxID=4460 RepID=A0A843TE32_COLES|nr:hypothetical protein [Colocasia esculenta]